MVDASQLREFIVRPALKEIGLWSLAAENLVMGTGAQESRLRYVKQIGGGPALGLFQMEPATHNDIWTNYLIWNQAWSGEVKRLAVTRDASGIPLASEMIWNLKYAAAMCRVFYRRKPGALPDTVEGMAAYWKRHWNTFLRKGTVAEFIKNYELVRV